MSCNQRGTIKECYKNKIQNYKVKEKTCLIRFVNARPKLLQPPIFISFGCPSSVHSVNHSASFGILLQFSSSVCVNSMTFSSRHFVQCCGNFDENLAISSISRQIERIGPTHIGKMCSIAKRLCWN